MAMLKTRLTACALAVAITTTTMPARKEDTRGE